MGAPLRLRLSRLQLQLQFQLEVGVKVEVRIQLKMRRPLGPWKMCRIVLMADNMADGPVRRLMHCD